MSKPRHTIGRTFSAPVLKSEASAEKFQQVFTLSSGRKVLFSRTTVPASDVEATTYVVQENNGRDQSALTPESLKDITRTLRLQQFFPTIGVRNKQGIEILDGSRRRASALIIRSDLHVLVTDDPLTSAEARALAKDIQTAREHNIREVGLRLQTLKSSGLSQKEIAESEGLSQATVTRALQAASVSTNLLSVFPVQAVLSFSDYKTLLATEELLSGKGITQDELLSNLTDVLKEIHTDESLADDEVKSKLIAEIRKEALVMGTPLSRDKAVTTSLWQFGDKNRFARKKTKGRTFSYEFNRLAPEVQSALDEAIGNVLSAHLNK
ncbi:ParB family protein [Erwinia tasmaniensis]|uniref:Plasmid partition protein B n=1 Tax=Erwinia tasmaniensis (strain DSM 17950 / CFBP 7177 / CIP 109463 / NCPPB 4357 / Et1/99) TaxID=465817 RepID=B2VB65_ERWT9|nr:ParB family protein [Erwinia tasmaniensis]CAO95028.1 Plasmid partition protein B [Erwinia tasmaniensis Et1/99]